MDYFGIDAETRARYLQYVALVRIGPIAEIERPGACSRQRELETEREREERGKREGYERERGREGARLRGREGGTQPCIQCVALGSCVSM